MWCSANSSWCVAATVSTVTGNFCWGRLVSRFAESPYSHINFTGIKEITTVSLGNVVKRYTIEIILRCLRRFEGTRQENKTTMISFHPCEMVVSGARHIKSGLWSGQSGDPAMTGSLVLLKRSSEVHSYHSWENVSNSAETVLNELIILIWMIWKNSQCIWHCKLAFQIGPCCIQARWWTCLF